jgi:hypothetical protein
MEQGSTNSPLAIVTDIADQIVGRRLAQSKESPGMRPATPLRQSCYPCMHAAAPGCQTLEIDARV